MHPAGRYGRTLRLTQMAMFVALTLTTKFLPSPPGLGGLLHFTGFPVILSGFVLGPWGGFCVGAVSDVLGFLLKPSSQFFFPGFTLTQALTGALPVLIAGRQPVFWRYLVGILVAKLVTSVLMVPVFCQALYGLPFWTAAPKALYAQLVHAPLYAFAAVAVVRALSRSRL